MADSEEDRQILLADVNLHDITADERRIIIVGKTGNGKSTTGNRLLDKDDVILSLDNMTGLDEAGGGDESNAGFIVSPFPNSCTSKCQFITRDVWGRKLAVVDTPGFFATQDPLEVVMLEVTLSLSLCAPGPHIVLLVVRLDVRFSEEEKQVIDKVVESLGAGVERHLIVVFTFGDILNGQPVDKLLSVSPDLNNLVQRAGGRCVVFTNKKEKREAEVRELLEKIEALLAEKGEEKSYFTNATFQKLSEELRKKVVKVMRENPQLSHSEALLKIRQKLVRREERKFALKLVGIVVLSTVFGVLVGVSGGAALGASPLIVAGVAEATAIGAAIGATGTSILSSLGTLAAAVKRYLPKTNKSQCVIQ